MRYIQGSEDLARWRALEEKLDEPTRKAAAHHPHLAVWILAERDLSEGAYARALSVMDHPDFLREVKECLLCRSWLAIHPELQILHDLLQIKHGDDEESSPYFERLRRMIRSYPEIREKAKALIQIVQSEKNLSPLMMNGS